MPARPLPPLASWLRWLLLPLLLPLLLLRLQASRLFGPLLPRRLQ